MRISAEHTKVAGALSQGTELTLQDVENQIAIEPEVLVHRYTCCKPSPLSAKARPTAATRLCTCSRP